MHVDLDDTETADALALFPRCIGFVEGEMAKGRRVLVHCHLGMSTLFHSVFFINHELMQVLDKAEVQPSWPLT